MSCEKLDSGCLLASYSIIKGDKLRLSQRSMGHGEQWINEVA